MKGKTAFNAMEGIDPRYILEAAPDAPVRTGSKTRYIRILAVAATVAVLTAVAVLGAGILKRSGENPPVRPPVVPPVGETDEVQTPAEGEDETAAPADGSYSTDLYTVTEIDGKHYINFVDGNEKPAPESGEDNIVVSKGIYFNSITEMKQKFLSGNFDKNEIQMMKAQLTLTDMGFEIPDMTKLQDVVLPEAWSVKNIKMDSSSISINIQNPSTYNEEKEDLSGEYGYIGLYSDKQYAGAYDFYFASYIDRIKNTLVDDRTTFMGMPCKVYEHTTSSSKIRVVVISIEEEDKRMEFMLSYYLEHKNAEEVNSTIPHYVSMFGEINGTKVHAYLSGLENEPSMEFLQSFGIQLDPATHD